MLVRAVLGAFGLLVFSACANEALDTDDEPTGALTSEAVVSGIPASTDFAFAPDGRIFIAEKEGAVRIVEQGAVLPTPFLELTVNTANDRGLIGLTLDPDFESNGYAYLYYTHEHANDLDEAAEIGPRTGQILRVRADGNVAEPGSEHVLIGSIASTPSAPSCEDFPPGADCLPADGLGHQGGQLRFSSDGKLYIATGDAALFLEPPPNQLEMEARAQDLDSLAGKLLRVEPDGSAPPDNPFFTGEPTENRSKVWAYGLRNPFRFGLQPGSDLPFIADVGSDFWEEINIANGGENFGWPCYEGREMQPEKSASDFCQDVYATDATTNVPPVYSYEVGSGAAIIGGVFYEGTEYPSDFEGAFFFGDWVHGTVSALKVGANNDPAPDGVVTVLEDAGQPVAFETGPEGNVYYLTLDLATGLSEIRRIVGENEG